MLAQIQLLVVDLDGTTLTPRGTVSPRVIVAMQRAAQRGVRVTVATGRNLPSTINLAKLMHVNAPIICLQGSLIYDLDRTCILKQCTLPLSLICELISAPVMRWPMAAYQADQIFVDDEQLARVICNTIHQQPVLLPNLCHEMLAEGVNKLLFAVPPEEISQALQTLRSITQERAHVLQSDISYVELIPQEADKGKALRWLAHYLGVPRELVMAIGDQESDINMIEWAGIGVAMGNAAEKVKAAANWIAPSIEQDGAAVAIEHFVLRD